jgi:hypothetical protein
MEKNKVVRFAIILNLSLKSPPLDVYPFNILKVTQVNNFISFFLMLLLPITYSSKIWLNGAS